MERWQQHVQKNLVKVDAEDAAKLNEESGQPEFAQNCYLKLRQQDESRRIFNYLDVNNLDEENRIEK